MATPNIAFEKLGLAVESVKGTAVTTPTNVLNMGGELTPSQDIAYSIARIGVLSDATDADLVGQAAKLKGKGSLDVNQLPILAQMVYSGAVTAGVAASQRVIGVNITNGGTGYSDGPFAVTGSAGGGTGFAGKAWASGGVIQGCVVTASGTGYTSAPTLDFTAGSGSGAAGTVTLQSTGAASVAKVWVFPRTLTSDDLKTATFHWGDTSFTKNWDGPYGVIDTLKIAGEPSGTDPCTMEIEGTSRFPSEISPATWPAASFGPIIRPRALQLYIDGTQGYGNTAVSGRVTSFEYTVPTGFTYAYADSGPTGTGGLSFSETGREAVHPELKLTLLLADLTQYDQWAAATKVRVRLKLNGAQLEAPTGGTVYWGCWLDIYGTFDGLAWGDENGKRTVEVTIHGLYDTALGTDAQLTIFNKKTAV